MVMGHDVNSRMVLKNYGQSRSSAFLSFDFLLHPSLICHPSVYFTLLFCLFKLVLLVLFTLFPAFRFVFAFFCSPRSYGLLRYKTLPCKNYHRDRTWFAFLIMQHHQLTLSELCFSVLLSSFLLSCFVSLLWIAHFPFPSWDRTSKSAEHIILLCVSLFAVDLEVVVVFSMMNNVYKLLPLSLG